MSGPFISPLMGLQQIETTLQNQIHPNPPCFENFHQPKDWNNITHDDVKKILESVERTNEWIYGAMVPAVEELEICNEKLEEVSAELNARFRKFEQKNAYVFTLTGGVKLIMDRFSAIIVKANTVVMAVIFKPRTWSDSLAGMSKPVYLAAAGVVGFSLGFFSYITLSYMRNRGPV